MLTPEQMTLAMSAVRDQVLAAMARHEREEHGGAACMGNRASTIAYLANCLGVRDEVWDYARVLLDHYDANCVDRNCRHDTARGRHDDED